MKTTSDLTLDLYFFVCTILFTTTRLMKNRLCSAQCRQWRPSAVWIYTCDQSKTELNAGLPNQQQGSYIVLVAPGPL